MRIEPSAYEFTVYDPNRDRWLTMNDEGEFRRRNLPKGVTFQLELDSIAVVLKPVSTNLNDGPPPGPQLAIAASGEGTPFRLTLLRDATQARAAVDRGCLRQDPPRKLRPSTGKRS